MVTDFTKQEELFIPHEFTKEVHVIGCGALGSWVVMFLAKMGFRDIYVYDYDKVEEHNLPNQFFSYDSIGKYKVLEMETMLRHCMSPDEAKQIKYYNRKLTDENTSMLRGVVLCCVDSMATRKMLYEQMMKYSNNVELFIEARLSIWGAYVYTILKENGQLTYGHKYEETLYADTEAEVSACGISQTALPAAVNAATIMIMQLIKWHRNELDATKIEYQIPELVAMTKDWRKDVEVKNEEVDQNRIYINNSDNDGDIRNNDSERERRIFEYLFPHLGDGQIRRNNERST